MKAGGIDLVGVGSDALERISMIKGKALTLALQVRQRGNNDKERLGEPKVPGSGGVDRRRC